MAWAVLLLASGLIAVDTVPLAAVLGATNTAVGILARRVVAWPRRRLHQVS